MKIIIKKHGSFSCDNYGKLECTGDISNKNELINYLTLPINIMHLVYA